MALRAALLLCALLSVGLKTGRACHEHGLQRGPSQLSQLCYQCTGWGNYCLSKPVMCPSGFSKCMSSTIVLDFGGTSLRIKKKECIDDCVNGSMNFGITKMSSSCCDTAFCNAGDAPDPRFSAPNGRTCYYCDGLSCSNTVSCSGTEDSCITATVTNRGPPMLLKGCITKSVCGLLKCSFIQDLSCCEGNLCNADKSLNLSVINKGDTYRAMNEGAEKSDTYRSLYEGAKKSDTYGSLYEGAEKSDTYGSLYEGAEKSDTYGSLYEGAKKSDTYGSLYEGAKKSDTYGSLYEGAEKSDTYGSLYEGAEKSDTYGSLYEGAKKSDTYGSLYEGAKKSDTYRAMNEKSDTYRAMNEGAEKSDTQRSPYNGAKSVTHSFLFSALLLPAALILQ